MGEALFERLHHQFRLTEAGARLQAGLEPIFGQLENLLQDMREEGQYQLRVGVPSAFATAWLMPRLQDFRSRHPSVDVRFDSSGSPLAKLGLSLDAIVYFAHRDELQPYMHQLRPQRAFAVAAPGLVDTRSGLRQAMREHTLLLHSRLSDILPKWLKEVGRKESDVRKTQYFDDGGLLVSAAENGLGIALVLEDMVNFYPRSAKIIRPFGECAPTPYSYCLGTKPASGNSKAVSWFRDWLLEQANADARQLVAPAPAFEEV